MGYCCAMKVMRKDDVPEREVSFNRGLFTGPASSQTMVDGKEAGFSVAYIHFPEGVRNKFHTHTGDQVLIVTEGRGMVATAAEEIEIAIAVVIRPGKKSFLEAGERLRVSGKIAVTQVLVDHGEGFASCRTGAEIRAAADDKVKIAIVIEITSGGRGANDGSERECGCVSETHRASIP